MATIKLENFGGMIPAVDDRLLPDGMSVLSRNAWLYSGAARGISEPQQLYTLQGALTRRVFRIPKNYYDKKHLAESWWMEFADIDTDVVHAPIINDSFDRYYWASPNDVPRYDTGAHITAASYYSGAAGYVLGVPAPTIAPTIGLAGGVSAITDVRAYVYTHVTAYGEEGPPSPPSIVTTGKVDDTWTITVTAVGADATGRNITATNIYRTITSSAGVATYFFVAQIPIATLTYADTIPNITVVGNNEIESTEWSPPPTLEGMKALPNGIIAGFKGTEVWFCEPYRPHAWPAGYTLSVEHPVVGFGSLGQTLVVLTTGHPYAVQGVTPGSMSLTKISNIEPCLSRGSIVSTPDGVFFASPNGLMMINGSGLSNLTQALYTKDKWLALLDIERIRATRVGSAYYAFGHIIENVGPFYTPAFSTAFEVTDYTTSRDGFIIDLLSQRVAVTLLVSEDPTFNIMTDEWSGEPFVIRNNSVYWLDISEDSPRNDYIWKSKVFQAPERKNFNAMRVYWVNDSDVATPPAPPRTGGRFPANTTLALTDDMVGIIRVFADGVNVLDVELVSYGQLIRLPSGYKATDWQVEIVARTTVHSIEMATTVKELMVV